MGKASRHKREGRYGTVLVDEGEGTAFISVAPAGGAFAGERTFDLAEWRRIERAGLSLRVRKMIGRFDFAGVEGLLLKLRKRPEGPGDAESR